MRLIRIAVAFVIAFILIGIFQKALARESKLAFDEAPLAEISAISIKGKDKITITCGQLKARAQAFNDEILADGETLAHFTQLVSQSYSSWFSVLSPLEEQYHVWAQDSFKPVETSCKNLDASAEELYAWVDIYGQELEALAGAINNCIPDSEMRKNLLAGLATFGTELSDCQSTSAGFIADMKTRLKDWTRMWRALEGTPSKVPVGYFQSLKKGSDDLSEASQLFRENAQLLSEHFKPLLPLFGLTFDVSSQRY